MNVRQHDKILYGINVHISRNLQLNYLLESRLSSAWNAKDAQMHFSSLRSSLHKHEYRPFTLTQTVCAARDGKQMI